MFSTTFIVFTTPVAKGRPKFRRIGNFVSAYTPKKTIDAEKEIAEVAKKAMNGHPPLETALTVCIYFRMPIPASYSKKKRQDCIDGIERHTKKIDLDNATKLVLDSLNGIVYKDDSQIVSLHMTKVYAATPAIEVLVTEDLE